MSQTEVATTTALPLQRLRLLLPLLYFYYHYYYYYYYYYYWFTFGRFAHPVARGGPEDLDIFAGGPETFAQQGPSASA
eukprot:2115030-Pyramimonas_sp.AAC.1